MAIDEWFIPSVLVANAIGSVAYCSGTTMALRREVLDAVGGFEVLAPLLADDYELGARIRRLGLRSVIGACELSATVNEPTFTSLIRHELRWLRTVRTITPVGHFWSFLTYTLPLTLLAVIATGFAPWSFALPAAALVLRAALHWAVRITGPWEGAPRDIVASVWYVPVRDLLSFALWIASYASRRVTWRGNAMWVSSDGVLRNEETSPA
jgi:ceramide glucosyltransferase